MNPRVDLPPVIDKGMKNAVEGISRWNMVALQCRIPRHRGEKPDVIANGGPLARCWTDTTRLFVACGYLCENIGLCQRAMNETAMQQGVRIRDDFPKIAIARLYRLFRFLEVRIGVFTKLGYFFKSVKNEIQCQRVLPLISLGRGKLRRLGVGGRGEP